MARAGRIREWRDSGGKPGSGPSDRNGERAPRRRLHGSGARWGTRGFRAGWRTPPLRSAPHSARPLYGKLGRSGYPAAPSPADSKDGRWGGGPRDKGRGHPTTSGICSARGKLRGARGRAGLPEGRSRREGGWAPEQHRRKWEDWETRGARASAQKAALRHDLGSPGHPKGSHLKLKMRLDPSARLCLQNLRLSGGWPGARVAPRRVQDPEWGSAKSSCEL